MFISFGANVGTYTRPIECLGMYIYDMTYKYTSGVKKKQKGCSTQHHPFPSIWRPLEGSGKYSVCVCLNMFYRILSVIMLYVIHNISILS